METKTKRSFVPEVVPERKLFFLLCVLNYDMLIIIPPQKGEHRSYQFETDNLKKNYLDGPISKTLLT